MLLVLPFALVVGAVIALAIAVDSPGPVIYRCRRIGQHGREFAMLKFRKMREGAEGPLLTEPDDSRFTPIGRFLTVTRLDELPQLVNVLRGDMRLVGPRPEVEEFVNHHPREYAEILSCPPGLTGLAQLEFFQESRIFGEAHASEDFYREGILPRKIELDLSYVRGRTLRGDVRIIAKTFTLPARAAARAIEASLSRHSPAQLGLYALAVVCATAIITAFAVQA